MSDADPTAAELLTETNAAILALLRRRVKSYNVFGTSYTYEDLGELRAMRGELQKETVRSERRPILLGDVSRRA